MEKFNINDLLTEIDSAALTPVNASGGSSKFSFGLVYSTDNGKRFSISKALAERLGITDHVELAPNPKRGVLLLANNLHTPYASSCQLRGDGKKIGYSSQLIKMLIDVFQLDFSGHVSMSFSDVTFENYNGETIAVIRMTAPGFDDSTASGGEA